MGKDTDHVIRLPQEVDALAVASVEHYTRLHEYVEQLRQDKRPPPPGALAPEDARAYQMAALLRSTAPGAVTPDRAFIALLQARIRQELGAAPATRLPPTNRPTAAELQVPMHPVRRRRGVSRRALLGAGLGAAAAGLAAGVALGCVTQPSETTPFGPQPAGPLVPAGAGVWVAVAAAQDLPLGAVKRFATEAIVGYVRHTPTGFAALSGICTHMGCLLNWNGAARTYDCPCHGGRFAENGDAVPSSSGWNRPLAQIATRVRGGIVEVYMPPPVDLGGTHLGGNPAARRSELGYQAGK